MFAAVERVRFRRDRAVAALEKSGTPYALIGAHAVAYWVGTKDEGAIRNTPNSDFLVHDRDFDSATVALASAGFVHKSTKCRGGFANGQDGTIKGGIRLWIVGEKVHEDNLLPLPDLTNSFPTDEFRVVSLHSLLQMKLVANRNVDGAHLRDMLGVGLFDWSWPDRFPPILAERLRHVLNNPDG